MASSLPLATGPLGVDMNDPSNLALRDDLVRFQVDRSRHELRLVIGNDDKTRQRTLQSLAHSLDLNYEYSLATREARITRSESPTPPDVNSKEATDDRSVAFQGAFDDLLCWPDDSDAPILNEQSLPNMTQSGEFLNGINFQTWDFFEGNNIASSGSIWNNYINEKRNIAEAPQMQSSDDSSNVHNIEAHALDAFSEPSFVSSAAVDENVELSPGIAPKSGFSRNPRPLTAAELDLELEKEQDAVVARLTRELAMLRESQNSGRSRPGSSRSSISSMHSNSSRNRISKVFSRRSSFHQRESPAGYQEIVFDSNSSRPESRASVSSGRTGPLDVIARAAMKAVRTVGGACWRCKLLRKQCDAKSPCDTCPKASHRSIWSRIGCKRGSVKNETSPITFCPRGIPSTAIFLGLETGEDSLTRVNACLRARLEHRSRLAEFLPAAHESSALVTREQETETDIDSFLRKLQSRWPSLADPQLHMVSLLNQPVHPSPSNLVPLDQCIWMIFREAFVSDSQRQLRDFTSNDLVLLRAAALYQSKIDTDHLISLSLICLRVCLEAVNMTRHGLFESKLHFRCENSSCEVDCIQNLTSAVTIYLDELNRVLFCKEHIRNKRIQWLSIFYSLCIQSKVRQALINLVETVQPSDKGLDARSFLHLAVRLFNANSGTYDPLSTPIQFTTVEYRLAQDATHRKQWRWLGVNTSAEYLEHLFEDAGSQPGRNPCASYTHDMVATPEIASLVEDTAYHRHQMETAKGGNEILKNRVEELQRQVIQESNLR